MTRFLRSQASRFLAGTLLLPCCALLHAAAQTDAAPLPDAPSSTRPALPERPTVLGTPKRILHDELAVIASPARLKKHDLVWLLPLAGATAASLCTDTYTMQHVVTHNADFNASASTSSDALLGVSIGGPILLFATGQVLKNDHAREAGLLAGEAMIDSIITDEGIKYITLRERPIVHDARGHFFQGDAVSDPSFVSGHSIVAWSSAAVLAAEYSRPWQQAAIYTLASGVSLTRVLSQQHFPTDALLGAASGWLIGRYVYRTHHRIPR